MGRAPNPGAPQRVSAHVLPKTPSFAADDEDEKTTIESGGWEEEASTTVEQGEVADKVRALGLGVEPAARPNTAITSTSSMSDEPTVDDQRANAAIALLPPPSIARLVITQGNDAGQAIEVRPGKSYTIGRAIDNDLVLTDMTVSRKHFDLRNDNRSWVLADRGSGNGTLINTRLEDAPFTLANGDVIEIGNTTFRFELPNGVPRVPSSYGHSDDDLELSTMSDKPLEHEAATPARLAVPVSRPKTLPPPAPLPRPHATTNRPPLAYGLDRPSPQPLAHPPVPGTVLVSASAPTISPVQGGLALHQPPPATTLPLPQMANRPPLQPSALLDPAHGPPSTTLPGQGPPMHPAHPARLPFSYPGSSEMPTLQPRGTSRAMAVVSAQAPRDTTSTAQVPPMSYSNAQGAIAPPQAYSPPPPLSRRAKIVLGGAGLALFAAIATIAIIKGASSDGVRSPRTEGEGLVAPAPAIEPRRDPTPVQVVEHRPTRTITPIEPSPEPTPSPATPPAPTATRNAPTATRNAPIASAVPSVASPVVTPISPSTAVPPPAPPSTTAKATVTPSPVTSSTDARPPTPATASPASTTTPSSPAVAPSDPAATPARAGKNPAGAAGPRTDRAELAAPRTDRRPAKRAERKPDRPDRRTAATRADAARIAIDRTEKAEAAAVRSDKKPSGRTTRDVKNDANALYRARDFSGAAALVTQALSSFSGADSQELKSIAAIYLQLGKSFHIGMGPATKFTDAYVALRRALNYDRDVGSVYVSEIQERLVITAARAAMQFMAAKDYEPAFQAVRVSESLGSTSPSNKLVREKLESLAADLLRSAQSEASSNPEESRRKARQVEGMVDTKHPLHVKATKLLTGS